MGKVKTFTRSRTERINTEFMDANRKIKKLSDISEFQMIMYEEKTLYMNDNLGRLLKLMEANDISHNKSELFQCEKRGRNSVYLYGQWDLTSRFYLRRYRWYSKKNDLCRESNGG